MFENNLASYMKEQVCKLDHFIYNLDGKGSYLYMLLDIACRRSKGYSKSRCI